MPPTAGAAPITARVTTTADSGPGSLRQVLADIPAGGVIVIGPELSFRTITLQSTLVIDKHVNIDGTAAVDVQISGNDAVRILDVGNAGTACNITVKIFAVRLVHALSADPGTPSAAVATCATTLKLTRVSIEDSQTASGAAGVDQTAGDTTIVDSRFTRNHATHTAGVLIRAGQMLIERVTFDGNGGTSVVRATGGTATVRAATFTGNQTVYGGILTTDPAGTITVVNSTIADNTVTNYSGDTVGVLSNHGTLSLQNSILSNASANCSSQSGIPYAITDLGHNVEFGNNDCGLPMPGDPQLGTLGFYGSALVPVIPIAATSVARDAGDNTDCTFADGRELRRPATGGNPCDIGAFEYDGPLAFTVTTLNDSGPGSLRQAIADAGSGATIDFQAGLSGTLSLDSGLEVLRALTIQGPGAGTLAIGRNTASGAFGLLHVNGTCETETVIRGLTMTGGDTSPAPGSAILSCGPLLLEDMRFVNNNGSSVVASTDSQRPTVVRHVRFDGNPSGLALQTDVSATTIVDSSFAGPLDRLDLMNDHGYALLRNVTFNDTDDAAIATNVDFLALEHVTVTADYALQTVSGQVVSVGNSILRGTTAVCTGDSSVVESRGHNVIDGGACGTLASAPTNLAGNPRLAPFALNEPGTVYTRGLMLDSPAINLGGADICPPEDARGFARSPSACDAGAFEAQTIALTSPLPMGAAGVPFTTTITATGGYGAATLTVSSGTLPPGLTLAANGTTSSALSGTPTIGGSFDFIITALDATGVGALQAYTLVVDGGPTVTGLTTSRVLRDGTLGPIDFVVGDDFTSPTALILSVSSSNQALVPDANITLGGSGAARTVSVTPLPHVSGTATITLTTFDGIVTTTTTFDVIVMAQYVLAEGATGGFFDLDLLLANPNATPAPITIRFVKEDGTAIDQDLTLTPTSRTTLRVDDIAGLEATAVSTIVTSTQGLPIVVERTMTWDASGYGSHTEKATDGAASTWYFAEGSQGFFSTYLLLANQDANENAAHVTYLREGAPPVSRDYALPPTSRLTIDAGTNPELVNQSFGAVVSFDRPGVAERSMYFGASPIFTGGTASAGVTAPSTSWFLAEGATGSFFTTFLLITNPDTGSTGDADVTVTYLPAAGSPVTRSYAVAPGARITLNVALQDPSLESAAVAARVESTRPVVVERSQYWPQPVWIEAHNSFGVTDTATRWGLAEGRVGGAADYQTYILLANPGEQSADVTVTFLRQDGTTLVKTFTAPPTTRVTVAINGPGSAAPELANESFGALIESTQPIVVERSMYSNANGVVWAAGTNATATKLP